VCDKKVQPAFKPHGAIAARMLAVQELQRKGVNLANGPYPDDPHLVERLNPPGLIPIFRRWSPDAVVRDGASAHRGKAMGEVGFERIVCRPIRLI
jgi:hypothetical protein